MTALGCPGFDVAAGVTNLRENISETCVLRSAYGGEDFSVTIAGEPVPFPPISVASDRRLAAAGVPPPDVTEADD